MKKAEEMRRFTEKATEKQRMARVSKSHKYAQKIADTKLKARAKNGFNNCQFTVSRWQSPTLVVEQFENMGFEVKRNSKNGRAVLAIKW